MGLVHEVTGGVDCSFTPQGSFYPYLGGQEEFTKPWNEGSQADFSDKTSVGHRWILQQWVWGLPCFCKAHGVGGHRGKARGQSADDHLLGSQLVPLSWWGEKSWHHLLWWRSSLSNALCCGLRPSGPAPEPWKKEDIAARIWAVLKLIGEVSASGGGIAWDHLELGGVFVEGCWEILHWVGKWAIARWSLKGTFDIEVR